MLTAVYNSANWVNQLQPLFIAGWQFCFHSKFRIPSQSRDDEDEITCVSAYCRSHIPRWKLATVLCDSRTVFPDIDESKSLHFAGEQVALLQHLKRIQLQTGW